MPDTVRTTADLLSLLADNQPAHASNRQLFRDLVSSFGIGRNSVVNATDAPYNAVAGAADNTLAIQAAIDACSAAGGGRVVFPPGTFKTGALTWRQNVRLQGAGLDVTTLQSIGAGTMLTLDSTTGFGGSLIANVTIEQMTLDGNSIGTKGIALTSVARFYMDRVHIERFTAKGVENNTGLVFQVYRSQIDSCVIGVDGFGAAPNLVMFRDTVIVSNTTYGIQWINGAMLMLHGCDIEGNGTVGNAATGAIKVGGMDPVGAGIGLIIDSCWLEANNGHSNIRINAPASTLCRHVVRNTHGLGGTRTYGLYVEGATRYLAQTVVMSNATTADFFDAATSIGTLIDCSGSTISLSGSLTSQWPNVAGNGTTNQYSDRFTFRMAANETFLLSATGARLGIEDSPDAGVSLQVGSRDGSKTAGTIQARLGAYASSVSRGSGWAIVTTFVTAAAQCINEMVFSFRNNANTGEGPTGGFRVTKPAGTDKTTVDLMVGTGSGGGTRSAAQFDDSSTAGNSDLLLYCVDTGGLTRVKTGAAGTGPGGSGRALFV